MTDALTFDRRSALRLGAVGGIAALTATVATSCAAPATIPVAGAVITSTWFADMTAALAAGLLTVGASEALDAAWSSWQEGFTRTLQEENERGYGYYGRQYCGDAVPPSLLVRTFMAEESDPTTDRLIALVNNGAECVAFDPWAWKALCLYVADLTADKSGDTLAGYQALCRISLLPNATVSTSAATASGRSELLAYKTRNGEVEMNRRTNSDGTTAVQVVATGIPSASDSVTTREFVIPEGYAKV